MGRYLVPAAMMAAMLAFATAALAAGLTPYRPALWPGAVGLAVLGGIIPMIYAVNIRIVPVFARRSWPGEGWLRGQVGLAVAGGWLVFAGRAGGSHEAALVGNLVALSGGAIFMANLFRLFRRAPEPRPAPPLPYPEHADIDRIATHFMRLAATSLLLGLVIGAVTSTWRPEVGRWDLVWAHTLLVGFFLSMAAGVCYHTLARWTGRRWRSASAIRLHLLLVALGLPAMLVALATDTTALFAVTGLVQAVAISLFLVNITPMVTGLPSPTRAALTAAMAFLALGVSLGAAFAIEPILGVWLRPVHAQINLFGWTGLLISGVGYYFLPRFAGQPLRWSRLAPVQLGAIAGGVTLSVAALGWRAHADGPAWLVLGGGVVAGAGFLLFALQVGGTFRRTGRATVAGLLVVPHRASLPAGLGERRSERGISGHETHYSARTSSPDASFR